MNLFSRSLINKIKVLEILLAFLMLFILFIAYKTAALHSKKTYIHHAIKISKLLSKEPKLLQKYLKTNSFHKINTSEALRMSESARALVTDSLIRDLFTHSGIELYENTKSVLLILEYKNKKLYFINNHNFRSSTILPISISALFFFLIIFGIYYYIKSAFLPLVRLEKNIKHFSKAEDVRVEYENAHDEIANIANAFYKAIEYNKKLKAQKDMYICMVMHEISTPLTKAKFITHFMQNSEEVEKLNALFNSMEYELDKVHEFESISTQISKMNIAKYSVNVLIEDICDVLLLQEENISICGESIEKEFDYSLFIVAIKNLIDNAIKYSPQHKSEVRIHQKYLEIKNEAIEKEALDIQKLLEPFKQGNECNSGMGLGLFLINEIITKHNFKLNYSFSDNMHIFRISFD